MADTLTAANVAVAGTGAVYRAVLGTTLPANADAYLPVAWKGHGYISQDGVSESIDEQTTDIIAWQNSDLVRKVMTSQDVTYMFSGLESNENMLTSYYGNYTAGVVQIRGQQGIRAAWVFDFIDAGEFHVRIAIPDGQVTQRGGVTRNAQGAFEYPITITCYPDTSGVKAYLYVDDTPVSST